jgi:prepilin-type N-terminal cleavage/methylation domain-containing protein
MQKIKIKAFTLIELLVVIAIIGILSALIIVGMNSTTQKATIARAQAFSSSLRNSLMSNLVSEWKLDITYTEGPDTKTADAWTSNNCTLKGPTHLPTLKNVSDGVCINNGCIDFDGIDDYLDCGNGAGLNPDYSFTVASWFNVRGFGVDNNSSIVDRQHAGGANDSKGYRIFVHSGSPAYFLGVAGDGTANSIIAGSQLLSPMNLNKWYYGVLTHSYATTNGLLRLYLNGELKDTKTINGYIKFPNTNGLKIGTYVYWPSVPNYIYNGLIDEVRIYDVTIPASQIQQNYFAGLNELLANHQINNQEYYQRISELSNNYAEN